MSCPQLTPIQCTTTSPAREYQSLVALHLGRKGPTKSHRGQLGSLAPFLIGSLSKLLNVMHSFYGAKLEMVTTPLYNWSHATVSEEWTLSGRRSIHHYSPLKESIATSRGICFLGTLVEKGFNTVLVWKWYQHHLTTGTMSLSPQSGHC